MDFALEKQNLERKLSKAEEEIKSLFTLHGTSLSLIPLTLYPLEKQEMQARKMKEMKDSENARIAKVKEEFQNTVRHLENRLRDRENQYASLEIVNRELEHKVKDMRHKVEDLKDQQDTYLKDFESEKVGSLANQSLLKSKEKIILTLQGQITELIANNQRDLNERKRLESELSKTKKLLEEK